MLWGPTNSDIVWKGHIALAEVAGGGRLDIFLSSIFSLFFLTLSLFGRQSNIEPSTVSKGR